MDSKIKAEQKKLKKGDILLLFLYVDNCSPIRGRTRLQKMAFVFEKEILEKYGFSKNLGKTADSAFGFTAHNYGPFSSKILELMDFFVNINMVQITCADADSYEEALDSIDDNDIINADLRELSIDEEELDICREPEYSLTKNGKQYVKDKLISYVTNSQIEALTTLKATFNKYSLNKILKYIYSKYPDMAKESLIKERVMEKSWQF